MKTKAPGIAAALVLLFVGGCSKSEITTSRELQPSAPFVLSTPPSQPTLATPNRPTAAERLVEIDRQLASPLTGTPEEADARTLLRAERAALISSGQVSYQSGNQAAIQTVQSNHAAMMQNSASGDIADYAPAAADSQNDQIVIAPNSQATSLPFLEQLTPTERTHYFQALRLQNSSTTYVNLNHRFGRGRGWGWSGRH